ncbi:hypothetical protein HK405_015175, partial [Cladochytrium tenue]
PDKQASKYGKFQIRRKRRPHEPPILEPLAPPAVTAVHDSHLVGLAAPAVRLWDRLRMQPRGGPKQLEFAMLCPNISSDVSEALRAWCLDFRAAWDAANLGAARPFAAHENSESYLQFFSFSGAANVDPAKQWQDIRKSLGALGRCYKMWSPPRLAASLVSPDRAASSFVIFIPNFFPQWSRSYVELNTVAADFLRSLAELTGRGVGFVANAVVPAVVPLEYLTAFPPAAGTARAGVVRDICFGVYARCRRRPPQQQQQLLQQLLPPGGTGAAAGPLVRTSPRGLFTPLYALAYDTTAAPAAPLLAAARAVDAPLETLLEPDRVIHVAYLLFDGGGRRRWASVAWCDALGESADSWAGTAAADPDTAAAAEPLDALLARIWRRTLVLVGWGGFRWRVVVGRLGGFDPGEVS